MRRVFFSFHYEADSWRANQVRSMWVTKGKTAAGFVDAAEFEKVKARGEQAIKNWINNQLKGTTVTVVLIGSQTLNRKWVKYEMMQSLARGNGLLGIHINQLKDQDGETKSEPIVHTFLKGYENETKNYDIMESATKDSKLYYKGVSNQIGKWIENAAKIAGH